MKQYLNKLLFVLGIVVLANIIPLIASAETFMYDGTQVALNVDASDPSATVASANIDCLGGSLCSNIQNTDITATYSSLSQPLVFSVWDPGLCAEGKTTMDLSGYPSGIVSMNFSGTVQSFGISHDVTFVLGANPSSVYVKANPSSIHFEDANLNPHVGTDINVSWTSSGADNCAEDNGRGGTGTTGSFKDLGVWDASTYTVFCYDISGTVSGYGEVSVTEDLTPTPTVTIFANGKNPETISYNNSVDISWIASNASLNADSCICTYTDGVSGGGCGKSAGNGNKTGSTVQLSKTTTFSVVCQP